MSSQKKRIVPEEGERSPVMQLNSVVLPAPFDPSTARRSPGLTVIVTSVSAASAPNIRVTPRSSSAAPAPTAERRCATLSMAMTPACADRMRSVALPAFPEPDHSIGGPEHDDEEAKPDQEAEAVAVQPDLDQEVEREGAQDDEEEGAEKRSNRPRNAADHGDDQDVDGGPDADRARGDLPIVPDLQDAAKRGDEGCEGVGRDAMRVDVETECGHAARIVAHALQRKSKRCARQIFDREVTQRCDRQNHIIERNVCAPVDAPEMRGFNCIDPGVAVEERPVLIGEIEKRRGDRERDHDGVDAGGTYRQRA